RFFGLLLVFTAGAAWAGEYAVLASGGRLRVDRHEIDGVHVRLYNSTGYIEMPVANVSSFETVNDDPAPAPAAPVPTPAAAPEPTPKAAPSALELADAAAEKYGLSPVLVRSVMAAESGYQQSVVSP